MKYVRSSIIPFVPASHEDPNNPGVIKKVLTSYADSIAGTVQMINWAELLPHTSFKKHTHTDMKEIFILMDGDVIVTVNTQTFHMYKGDLLVVDPKEEHSMSNKSDSIVFILAIGLVAI